LNKLACRFPVLLFFLLFSFLSFPKLSIAGDKVYFYHNDHLGSPLAMTDMQGNVVWRRDYKPFGEEIDPGGATATNTHKYTGKEYDAETGLYYYGARYYDPVIGRFLSVDPAGGKSEMPQTWNRYIYTLNNPYKYVDPDGRWVWGINVGGSFTARGMKGGGSTAFLLDSKGNFSVVTTQEAGAGAGKSGGLFNNLVLGGKETTVHDYAGTSVSLSGSAKSITGAITMPVYGDGERPKFFYEVGISPWSIGEKEAGVTLTFGQEVYTSDLLGRLGKSAGEKIYDFVHPSEKQISSKKKTKSLK